MKYLVLAIVATSIAACTQQPNANTQVTRQNTNNNTNFNATEAGFVQKNQGILLDSATTTVGLTMGLAEANPLLLGVCGTNPIAVGVCGLGVKKVLEKSIDSVLGDRLASPASKYVNSAGYMAGCANIAVITGVIFPANLALGAVCAKVFWDSETRKEAALKRSQESKQLFTEVAN
ncbi:hypothetical protein AB9F26_19565 [Falsihalocynthiibacter sp. BN13B15]|uniref:hypothetical protein n=1 Tax=Falsihalocynthiibacter sp. BN13B15 TaxID=3240871 RepID=UPI00350EE814